MSHPRTAIIIQARMGSSRLPGKVLKTVLGRPLLSYQMERLHSVRHTDEVIVATSELPQDQPIVDLCQKSDWAFFRGSEEDVLDRYYEAARHFKAHTVVRITADCPLIDPTVVEDVIQRFNGNLDNLDYVSNTIERSYPRGQDCEVFSFETLERLYKSAVDPYDREHVTSFISRQPGIFRQAQVKMVEDLSEARWTVDTPEDYLFVQNVIENLYPLNPGFSMLDVFGYLMDRPEVVAINAGIEQAASKETLAPTQSFEERIRALLN